MTARSLPFQITRIPGLNGEWIDLHRSAEGCLCISVSGYTEIDSDVLQRTIGQVMDRTGAAISAAVTAPPDPV